MRRSIVLWNKKILFALVFMFTDDNDEKTIIWTTNRPVNSQKSESVNSTLAAEDD